MRDRGGKRRRWRTALLTALMSVAAGGSAAIEIESVPLADSVKIVKGERRLYLLKQGGVLLSFPVALGFAPEGHKERMGDGRTPEGVYAIDRRNPRSRFHRSLGISYPNAADRARARARGADPGGDIMIHGLAERFETIGPRHLESDWTEGCIALTNEQIDVLWHSVPIGTPIVIEP